MKRLGVFLAAVPLWAAGTVPGRYIVELSAEPVAEHAVRAAGPGGPVRAALAGSAASRQRSLVRAQQTAVRRLIENGRATVLGGVETVANALFVRAAEGAEADLARLPGVKAVHPVRWFRPLLDHALPLHHVIDGWTRLGFANAGLGAKIAIIDSGVDIDHPGFQDSTIPRPDGYPRASSMADLAFTNNKVIVARSYAEYYYFNDPDLSARDHQGHGTGTAMVAAGVINSGPMATIAGVAPRASIGSYKVFGTPGYNDSATEDAILQAIEDAVSDGMDVISLSLGSDVSPSPQDDSQVQALERVAGLGILVVAAAGNTGPNPNTIGSPATGASIIAVGASANDRLFSAQVIVGGTAVYRAIPGNGPTPAGAITGPLKDVATLDSTGWACSALPAGSLTGAVALILRGNCTFEEKLNHAQAAGAVAGLVYSKPEDPDAVGMNVGSATLPAEMVSYPDGLEIKKRLSGTVQVTLQFSLSPHYTDSQRLADFSARGPNVNYTIKPDLVAVGTNLYTAGQNHDPDGVLYSADRYVVEQGTSFAAPLVSGAAALLKAARPGLSGAQYRSLLINSAAQAYVEPGKRADVQQAGVGILDIGAALSATAAAAPVSLAFGAGASDANVTLALGVTNVGAAADTFQISVDPREGTVLPRLGTYSLRLSPGQSAQVSVTFSGTGMAAGRYQGFVVIQGASAAAATRVPYWYAVASKTPSYITVLTSAESARAGTTVASAAVFRVTDASGIAITDQTPTVTVVSGGGRVIQVRSRANTIPFAYSFSAALGPKAGDNVFRIQVGNLSRDVTIEGY